MNCKLRIKHPSGAEFEAEGPAEFILTEKEGFLSRLETGQEAPQKQAQNSQNSQENDPWSSIVEVKNGLMQLKNKTPNLKAGEAALLLLAAKRQLDKAQDTSAIILSKAVKASGYAPDRLDRLLTKALREGLVKASGTKRNRTYSITDKGLERAWFEARKLA